MTNTVSINKSYWLKWAICLLVPLVILLLPTSEAFTPLIRKYSAITLLAILMFLFEILSPALVGMTLITGYAFTGVCTLAEALAPWANPIIYQCFCCIAIITAVSNTKLLDRVAYRIVLAFGGSYFGILCGLGLVGIILAIMIPSASTGMLCVAMAYGICQALHLQPHSKAAAGLMLMGVAALTSSQNFIYSPEGVGGCAAMTGTVIEGFNINYTEVIFDNIIFVPLIFMMAFIYSKVFKAEEEFSSADYCRQKLTELGKIDKTEIRSIIILIFLVLFLATSQFHGKNMAFGYIFATLLFYFEPLGIANRNVFAEKVNMVMPLVVASCMSIGTVGNLVGASSAVSDILFPMLANADSPYSFVLTTWVCGVLANILMTPVAIVTFLCPILAPIAEQLGYSAKVVCYLVYQAGNDVLFPYENTTVLMCYGFGMMSMGQFIKGNIVKIIVDCFWICVIAVPFWIFIGLL